MCAQVYQSSNVDETFGEGKRVVSILKLSFDVEFFSNEILITLFHFSSNINFSLSYTII